MIRCIAAIVLLLCAPFLFAALPSPEDHAAIADWFARVLRDGQPRKIEQELEPRTVAWGDVRYVLGRVDCVSAEVIDSSTTWESPDLAMVQVRLRATGLMKADWQPRMNLPDRWHLEVRRQADGSWRLRSVLTDESKVARCMLAERDPRDADHHFSTSTADPLETIARHAIYSTDPEYQARFTPLMEYALVLARECGSVTYESWVMEEYAVTAASRGLPGGLERAHRSLELARASADVEFIANAFLGLGLVYLVEGRPEEAAAAFREGSLLTEPSNDPVTALKVLFMHSWILGELHRDFESLRVYEKLQELARRYRWPEGEEMAIAGKAAILHRLGNLDQAVATWQEGANFAVANGNPDHAAVVYYSIGQTHLQQRRLELAIAAHERAARFRGHRETDDRVSSSTCTTAHAGRGSAARSEDFDAIRHSLASVLLGALHRSRPQCRSRSLSGTGAE